MPRQSLPTTSPEADFTVENYGTVFLVRCPTDSARLGLVDFSEPHAQWFGHALAVEAKFIGGLVSALRESVIGGLVSALRESGWTVR